MRHLQFAADMPQLRLLQFDVQAAAPLKDSGNDLIAIKGSRFHTIQVKTTTGNGLPDWPDDRIYTLLAIVCLAGEDRDIYLDHSEVYLVPKEDLAKLSRRWQSLEPYKITGQHIDQLFAA